MSVARRVLALAVAAGCGDGGGGEVPVDDWPGAVTWTWTFSDGGGCPAGVTTVHAYLASYDRIPYAVRLAPARVATAPCDVGTASFRLANPTGVPPHGRDTWLELVTDDGRVFAHSQVANTTTRDAYPAAVIEVPRGWVHAAWTLASATSQQPLACGDVPALAGDAGAVVLYVADPSDAVRTPAATACARGETWLALPAGTYDLSLGAFASLQYVLGEVPSSSLLGKATIAGQTVTPGATLELGGLVLELADP